VNIVTLLPFIVLIGAMFLMTRSAKNKQRAAAQMRNEMQPGTGVRTIGGLYATVKEVNDDTVVLEIASGVHALFAKNAIGAVLEDSEFDRIVNGHVDDSLDGGIKGDELPVVPDSPEGLEPIDLGKKADAKPSADGGTAAAKPGGTPAAKPDDTPESKAEDAKSDDEDGPATK
jgi:preprotein translocase subunit YajC